MKPSDSKRSRFPQALSLKPIVKNVKISHLCNVYSAPKTLSSFTQLHVKAEDSNLKSRDRLRETHPPVAHCIIRHRAQCVFHIKNTWKHTRLESRHGGDFQTFMSFFLQWSTKEDILKNISLVSDHAIKVNVVQNNSNFEKKEEKERKTFLEIFSVPLEKNYN